MTPFTVFEAIAAPLPDADIDTDIIFPARFLTLTQKRGLGRYAFHDKRVDDAGASRGFVLDVAPWRGAGILVTGPNFGCGSSREQAPWALADLGIRCLIAPSFGAIFETNCVRNGLLPIRLGNGDHARLLAHAMDGGILRIDLAACSIEGRSSAPIVFAVAAAVRDDLLSGADEIEKIMRNDGARIAAFEARHRRAMPWLTGIGDPLRPDHPGDERWPSRS